VEDRSRAACAPYLSVVIPAYNEGARLGSTLRAVTTYLAAQSYAWEVLAVDVTVQNHQPGPQH